MIIGMGSYLPSRVLTNKDLEKMVATTDEWIVSRTGIQERRIAADDETPSDMGAKAAESALIAAGCKASEIDLILLATMTPDYIAPSTAALVQAKIGATNAAAMDIQAACTGFLYGLSIAKAYVESGMYSRVLLIASEKMSSVMDYTDRNTCVLFGDGAAAVVVAKAEHGFLIDTVILGADGSLAELALIPAGGSKLPASAETVAKRQHYFAMEGREVFKNAVRRMQQAGVACLKKANVAITDIDWIVPHQANLRILEAVGETMKVPADRVYKTLHKYGNTSASSIAIALDELTKEEPLKKESHLLLLAFGVGLTWGAALLRKK